MKNNITLKLAANELKNGWRNFAVFVMCLALGVCIMGSINNFSAVIKSSLNSEAQSLLGGNMEIKIRGLAANSEQLSFIQKYGKISYVATMRSMLHYNNVSTLTELKAIDDKYPLIGEFSLNENISAKDAIANNGIAVDSILLAQTGLKIGDEVKIGEGSYIIRATIKNEPDRAVQIFSFGPRVILSHESLEKSGLLSTFSLTEHRYRILTSANITVDENYEKSVQAELEKQFPQISWRVATGTDGNQTLKRFLDQLLAFLSLSGLATFLIAGIGIGSSVRSYMEQKINTIATLKVQGATGGIILATYSLAIAVLALAGCAVGLVASAFIIKLTMPFIASFLPAVSGKVIFNIPALLLAAWYGFVITYLFSVPALFGALKIRPSLLFRSKIAVFDTASDKATILATAFFAALLLATMFITASDKKFIIVAIILILVTFLLFAACASMVKEIARRIRVKKPWLRLAIGNLYRPGATTLTVILAIGISLTVLIALTLTEANFQQRITSTVEEKAPSLFMIDIQPHQIDGLKKLMLQYADEENIMLYPMVRGRISALNGNPVEKSQVAEDVEWAIRNDRGISYSKTPPANANIVKGKWWEEDYKGEPLLSVDERFLDGMNLKIGDTISLSILGEDITAKIASARRIDYTTFQINFAMILSPNVIEEFPYTSLSTIYIKDSENAEKELIQKISQEFPGITTIRTREVVAQVKNIMQHIATALNITVAISLIAGIMVLASALSATIHQRKYDIAVLKVMGAGRYDILKSFAAEWLLLAVITSFIAAVIGTFSAWLIILRFPGQGFYIMPEVTLLTILSCIAVICITGYNSNRHLFKLRPSSILRNE